MHARGGRVSWKVAALVLLAVTCVGPATGQSGRKETDAKKAIRLVEPALFAVAAPGTSLTYRVSLKKSYTFDPGNGDGIVVTNSRGNIHVGDGRRVNSRIFELDLSSENNGVGGSATLQINVTNGNGRRKFVRGAVTFALPGGNELVTVSGVDRTITMRLPVGARPLGIDTAASGSDNFKTAFVCNTASNTVSAIDIPTNMVVATIPVGSQPSYIAVAGVLGAQTAYVTNTGSGTVTVFDAQNFAVLATIPVGTAPLGIVMVGQPAFNELAYVANQGSDSLSVIDVNTRVVVGTVPVGDGPSAIAVNGRLGIQTIAVTEVNANDVRLLDANTLAVVATVPVGTRPIAIFAGGPQLNLFYVANQGSNELSFIDINTNTETNRIPVGASPSGVTIASASGLEEVYTANAGDGTLTVVDSVRGRVSLTIPIGGRPRGLATIGPISLPSILVSN